MTDFEVISIVGPTAVGKTSLALKIAEKIDAEIVSLDAYQIYRGMDIGTAKATAAERNLVKHHLIDVVDIDFLASIADFTEWAIAAINEIRQAGKTAICVGGSGLYVQSVLEILNMPPTDLRIRQKYEARLEEIGPEALHAQLVQVDPVAANQIEVANSRRVVRALEVNEITGEPFIAELKSNPARYRDLRIGLNLPRAELNQKISDRVDLMIANGWIAEVKTLLARGLLETPTASKAIGYREIAGFLKGEKSLETAVAETIQATKRYGKRQVSWFKRDPKITWHHPLEINLETLI